jgi:Arc/MetJ-type ribon-helix-helix transcriptional regulator
MTMYYMEAVCVRLDKKTIRAIESSIKGNHYGTRTDFIREAIRDKLTVEERKQIALRNLDKYFGAAKRKVSDEEYEQVRDEEYEQVRDQVARKYAKRFGITLE